MTARPILLGIVMTSLCNCFYLASSYIVKNKNVAPGEITVFSAIIRILVFGSWSTHVKCKQIRNQGRAQTGNTPRRAWASLFVCNLGIAVTILLTYVCLSLMPLSDFIVFGFTSPAFTLMFAMISNRSKATVINISMCLLIVIGSCLVAQPTFVFGMSEHHEVKSPYPKYTLGVILALTSACISGMCYNLRVHCKEIPMAYFMLCSGIAKMAVGLFCPVFGLPNNLTDISQFGRDLTKLTMVATVSMLGMLFSQLAVILSNNPVLVSVTRSMEIVMALVVDMATLTDIDYHHMGIWYKIMGALIVTGSVISIALADVIQERLLPLCTCRGSREEEESLEEESQSLISTEPATEIGQGRTGYGASESSI